MLWTVVPCLRNISITRKLVITHNNIILKVLAELLILLLKFNSHSLTVICKNKVYNINDGFFLLHNMIVTVIILLMLFTLYIIKYINHFLIITPKKLYTNLLQYIIKYNIIIVIFVFKE